MTRLAVALALAGAAFAQSADENIAREVLALERKALDGWREGNPDPMLAAADPGITYFHVMTAKRLDGVGELKSLFEQYRGMPLFERYEIVNPKVQASGDMAVLTYQFVRWNRGERSEWNATQVYQKKKEGWRVIHTHYSTTQAQP